MSQKAKLCWVSHGCMLTPDGVTVCMRFNSTEEMQGMLKTCIPNGEWVEDMNGNKIDIELKYAI